MIVTILIFIAVLAVIVLVHELGHYLAAKRFKVRVDEFGFGFPPRITGIQKKETLFSLNAIPLGGFVKLKGEQGDHPEDEDSLLHKKIWQRAIIMVAGVAMNIFLAVVIFSIGFSIGIPTAVPDTIPRFASIKNESIQIVQVQESSPASQAGLQVGDTISQIKGQTPNNSSDVQRMIRATNEEPFTLTVLRNDEKVDITIAAKKLEVSNNEPAIGIVSSPIGEITYPFPYSIWIGIKESFTFLWLIITAFWGILVNIFTQQPVAADVVGPVGIAVLTGRVVDLGFMYLLQFVALISLNLAIINVLPIPALDGGRLLFLVIEKLRGKPVNQRVEAVIHNVGFVILLMLIAFVTVRDLTQLSFIQNLF